MPQQAPEQTQEDYLLLDRQLCFPLYAVSRLLTRLYQPLLEPLGLTYPQYVVLMILWQDAPCPISHIGSRALLATNTLTPLLKRLEQLGLISRQRSASDERVVTIDVTEEGRAIKGQCVCIPTTLMEQIGYSPEALLELKKGVDALMVRLEQVERLSSRQKV